MKGQNLIFFILILAFFNCSKDAPEIVLNQPFQITIESEFMQPDLKAVVLSNSLGGVLEEKILTEDERNLDLTIETLIDAEHEIIVTFLYSKIDRFDNRSYFNVKSGAVFRQKIEQPTTFKQHQVYIERTNQNQRFKFGNVVGPLSRFNTLGDPIEVNYPTDFEFFIFLEDKDTEEFKYVHVEDPEAEIRLDIDDFKSFGQESMVDLIDMENTTFASIKLRDNITGAGKKVPVFTDILSNDIIRVFEVDEFKKNDYEFFFRVSSYELKKRGNALPPSIKYECDLGSFINDNSQFDLFDFSIIKNVGEYLFVNRFYSNDQNVARGSWSYEGLYEEDVFFKTFPISFELKNAIPPLRNFQNTNRKHDFVKVYNFENSQQSEIEQFPFRSEDFYYDAASKSCSTF